MAHQVQVNQSGIVLPDGREYDSGATVTLTDREFNQIRSALFSGGSPVLTDLGEVAGTSGDLSGLGDVVIDSPQVGDVMKWDGSHWINAQPAPDIDVGPVGGGSGFHDGQALFWYSQATGLADGANAAPVTQDGTAVYGPDGTDVLDIAGSDPDSGGIPAGDDFILQRTGSDVLWFKTAGLYVVTVQGAAFEGLLVQVTYSALHPAHTASWQGAASADIGANGTMTVVVGAMDVAPEGLSSGGTLASHIFNNSGSPQDAWVTLCVTRVS
jgi:hypothetical protein